jgi:hypothetical protein
VSFFIFMLTVLAAAKISDLFLKFQINLKNNLKFYFHIYDLTKQAIHSFYLFL